MMSYLDVGGLGVDVENAAHGGSGSGSGGGRR